VPTSAISTPPTSKSEPSGAEPDLRVAGSGDHQSLTLEHLWLADAIARRYRGRGEDPDDLRQVARCGLLEAAARYDPRQGPFSSFAGPTISGVIKRHFRDHGWTVRPPRRTQQLALQINRQWSEVAQLGGNLPSERDLAASLGESVSDIREARSASQGYQTLSLDAASVPDAITAISDPEFERTEAKLLVARAWRSLDRAEQDLLTMRFWEERSQSDIAQRIGTSQMQVSRLLTKALSHLRQLLDVTPAATAA
jgi:RNA polymerase sigma-B factor